jgi:hypothetical protein
VLCAIKRNIFERLSALLDRRREEKIRRFKGKYWFSGGSKNQ